MLSGSTTTSYAYNAADELCASSTSGAASCSSPNYSWDADGNMLSSPTITKLVYNAKNQTVSRTYKSATQNLSYADADQTERVTEGNVTEAWSPLGLSEETTYYGATYYLRDNQGNPLGEYHNANNYYFLTDGQGSVVDVIEGANGETTHTYEYDPFGNVTELGNSTGSDVRFKGSGYWDKASSNPGSPPLYQIGTRYYDPTTGRWTQQDPIGGTISNPATANAYDYAGDDPINNIDPSGLSIWGDITGFFSKHQRAISCTLFAASALAWPAAVFGRTYEAIQAFREGQTLREFVFGGSRVVKAYEGAAVATTVGSLLTGGCV